MKTIILIFVFILSISFALSQTKISGIVNNYASVESINQDRDIITITNPNNFQIGDYVLIIQMKGAVVDSSNTVEFGKILNLKSCGNYEFAGIKNKNNDTITLDKNLCRKYDINGIVQLVKIPRYTNVVVDGDLIAKKWDGRTGGVLAIKVDNSIILNADIDVSGLGFRGGQKHNSDWQCNQMDYYYDESSWQGAKKGEGISNLNPDKLAGRGNLANGGGGGNCTNAGGAGGGNYGAGGHGGRQFLYACDSIDIGGLPGEGLSYAIFNDNKIFLAGGAGSGHENDFNGSSGGDGGGIVIIMASKIEGNAHTIFADGTNAKDSQNDAAGGGGAGGTILIQADNFGFTDFYLEAKGGKGGNCNIGPYVHCYGTGGGGSGGLIWLSASDVPDNVEAEIDGGGNGYITNSISPCYGSNYGAYPGENGAVLNELALYNCCDKTAFENNNFEYDDNFNLIENCRKSDSTITLTDSEYWQGGAIWLLNKVPVKKGFSTEFSFRFSKGVNTFSEEEYPGADGIAFVVQNFAPDALGLRGGGLGYYKIPNSLAVEYDTFKNDENNDLMESKNNEINLAPGNYHDPNENHIAVFCNGTEPNSCDHNSPANLGTVENIIPLVPDGRIFYSKIEYLASEKTMIVWLDSTRNFTEPVLTINNLDISQKLNLDNKEFAWVGFTSATGNAKEKHELLSWSFCPEPTNAKPTAVFDNQTNSSLVSVYPNPANDILYVDLDKDFAFMSCDIKIINLLGNTMLEKSINANNNQRIKLDVSLIPAGYYIVLINSGTNSLVKKVIIY